MYNLIIFSLCVHLTPVYFALSVRLFRWEFVLRLGHFPSRNYGFPLRFAYDFVVLYRPDWRHVNWVANAYGFDFKVWNDISHGLRRLK